MLALYNFYNLFDVYFIRFSKFVVARYQWIVKLVQMAKILKTKISSCASIPC